MRVTQRTMYNNYINGMQSTLGAYMESNIQGGSQKKINRPSDDPAGMALVLNTRNSIENITQFERNADTAAGWLKLADQTLTSPTGGVSAILERIKERAGQAANGEMTAENRKQIAFELREMFGQVLNMSNTEFEGKSLFGGHKYDDDAFQEGLNITTEGLPLTGATVVGKTKYTQLVEFTTPLKPPVPPVDPTAPPRYEGTVGTDDIFYRWSNDGGTTWVPPKTDPPTDGKLLVIPPPSVPPKPATIDQDGITLTLPIGTTITGKDPTRPSGSSNGLVMLRPTAIYMGDDQDMPPTSRIIGGPPGLSSSVQGTFNADTIIRFDQPANLMGVAPNNIVSYSYSTDNGATWVKAETEVPPPPTPPTPHPNTVRLAVPGGFIDFDAKTTAPATSVIPAGTQAIIHPNRAELGYEVMNNTYVSVNSVGKDIFGGMYQGKAVEGLGGNVFETIGELIAYCETNNQSGVSVSLDKLDASLKNVLTESARIAGLENRVSMAQDVLSFQKIDRQERLSYTEDVNLSELLTRLAQQQLAYNTVLKSSSMIMQLNLTKFV